MYKFYQILRLIFKKNTNFKLYENMVTIFCIINYNLALDVMYIDMW